MDAIATVKGAIECNLLQSYTPDLGKIISHNSHSCKHAHTLIHCGGRYIPVGSLSIVTTVQMVCTVYRC